MLLIINHLFRVPKGEVFGVAEVTTDLQPRLIDPTKQDLSRDSSRTSCRIHPRQKKVKDNGVEVIDSSLAHLFSLRILCNSNKNRLKIVLNVSASLALIASTKSMESVDFLMMRTLLKS